MPNNQYVLQKIPLIYTACMLIQFKCMLKCHDTELLLYNKLYIAQY